MTTSEKAIEPFEFPQVAVYFRDTRWQQLYAPNSPAGWRVNGLEGYRWYSWDSPTIKVCNTEEEAQLEVLRASWNSLSASQLVRFALNEPERAAELLGMFGDD